MRQYIARSEAQLRNVAAVILGLNPAKPWRIEIKRHSERRSLGQNRRYWVAIAEIASETGHSPDEIHTYAKHEFLPRRLVSLNDKDVEVDGSSAELDAAGFSEYLERVIAWAASDFGIQV